MYISSHICSLSAFFLNGIHPFTPSRKGEQPAGRWSAEKEAFFQDQTMRPPVDPTRSRSALCDERGTSPARSVPAPASRSGKRRAARFKSISIKSRGT